MFVQLNFQGRVINYKAEGRIHKLKWVYDGTAWDVESGTSVKAKHYQSRQGAIEHAVKELIEKLNAKKILTYSVGSRPSDKGSGSRSSKL